jgi:hypothetical protein
MKRAPNKRHIGQHDWDGYIFELGGPEGFRLEDMKICAFSYQACRKERMPIRIRRRWPLRIYVKVVGFEDDACGNNSRSWGKSI